MSPELISPTGEKGTGELLDESQASPLPESIPSHAERRTDEQRIISFNKAFALKLGFTPEEIAGRDAINMTFSEFKARADRSDVPVSIISLSTITYNYVNPAEAHLFGYNDPEEVIGKSLLFNAGYEGERTEDAMGKLFDTGSTSEKTIVRPDGEARELQGTYYAATGELDEYGLPAEFVGFDEDQTEKKRRADMFQRLSQFSYDWLVWLAPEGEIIYASPSSERITGYADQEWLTGSVSLGDIVELQDRPLLQDTLRLALESQEMGTAEFRVRTRQNVLIWMEMAYIPVYGPQGDFLGSRASLRDITENKDLQEKLVRAERLAVLGELAGSVSHELRNPLNVVKSSTFYLRGRLGDGDEKVARHLDRVERSVERADRTIGDLLAFSRLRPTHLEKTHLETLAQRVVSDTRLPAAVQISVRAMEKLPEVRVDQVQFEQVLHNLILNSCQALDGAGHVEIGLSADSGGMVMTVQDDGSGIAPENLPKVFDPLFTTKAEGTGFGLAVCKRVVEEHRGTIEVESKPGAGAKVIIRLPLEA